MIHIPLTADQIDTALLYACYVSYDEADFDNGTSQAILRTAPDAQYLAFRGTDEKNDWLLDSKALMKSHPLIPGRIHSGFDEALSAIITQIEDALNDKKRLIISGHSLGAAMAQLASVYLWMQGFNVTNVVLAGSPRAGNGVFVKAYESLFDHNTVTFIRAGDPVCMVPFAHWGYRHVPARIIFNDDGELSNDLPLATKWKEMFGQFFQKRGWFGKNMTEAHSRQDYYHDWKEYRDQMMELLWP